MPSPTSASTNPASRCVFCGARFGVDPAARDTAVQLGALLAREGITLVYGGGGVGLMGLVANAALAGGATVIGVIPQFLLKREAGHPDLSETVVVQTMHERKLQMFERSDAFVVLPGGLGTLEEFFEAWTAGYLGMHDKPLVMLDPFGHYDGLLAWLRGLADTGYVGPRALDRLIVVDDVEEALAQF